MLFRTMNLSVYVAGLMRAAGSVRALGPYAVVALIVPGGFLFALLLWAFRNRARLIGRLRRHRPRLNRITGIREATHSWLDPHTFGTAASAMVVLRAGRAAEQQQPQERRRGAGVCVRR
jgi:hypothetical protein